jgi:hypothetical protein
MLNTDTKFHQVPPSSFEDHNIQAGEVAKFHDSSFLYELCANNACIINKEAKVLLR